jgi:acetyltransferase-like isoleucine patch superfamily enzyme
VVKLIWLRAAVRKIYSSFRLNSGGSEVAAGYIHPESTLGGNTTIGHGTCINGPAFIASRLDAPVSIGKYCAIAFGLRIRPRNHFTGYPNVQDRFAAHYLHPSLSSVKGPVVIGNNVWIADNVIILSGVAIGDGAVIGAGSVVTRDVPPFHVAAGNPARVIRARFSDYIINQLLQVAWWDWPEEKTMRNKLFFSTCLSESPDLDIATLITD